MSQSGATPHRLPEGGLAIDRSRKIGFSFNGKELTGYRGDTLASALLASGRTLVARSFKYHRPRGFMASGPEDPCGLFGIGEGAQFEPNQRGTTTTLYPGLKAISQNHFPSLETDLGALVSAASKYVPAGFYYKTFLKPRAAWKHVFEPAIRQAAGLGRAPTEPDSSDYEHIHLEADVLIAGGGLAGIMAAKAAAAAGARVVLAEQSERLGGRALIDGAGAGAERIGEEALWPWLSREIAALEESGAALILRRAEVSMLEEHGYALIAERVRDHRPAGMEGAPRQRLWRVRAGRIVNACGAIERPIPFAYNDLPGIMLASAMRDYLALYAVAPGRRVALFTNNDDAYRTAIALAEAGVEVAAVIDWRPEGAGALGDAAERLGIEIRRGAAVARALGGRAIEGIEIGARRPSGRIGALERIACDALGVSGGWSPAVHLHAQLGGGLRWDAERAMIRPDLEAAPRDAEGRPILISVGAAEGALLSGEIAEQGQAVGAAAAAEALGREGPAPTAIPTAGPAGANAPLEAPIEALWFSPSDGRDNDGAKHFVDFQNDVTAADIEQAAGEGYDSVELAKRYTTLGMATDQGKLSSLNGLALLADATGRSIEEVGTTTFRPPVTPLAFGTIAGAAKGALFRPARATPMQGWHEAKGALFEPVGDWRRPLAYPLVSGAGGEREDREEAAIRETRAARTHAGLFDASTLGKILVTGPDAGLFLDRIYTGAMAALAPGRCRYGLVCDDNGHVFSDGVAARLDDGESGPEAHAYLCHAPSAGTERLLDWMEEWRQTEWHDLDLHIADLTEQYAQIALVGPKARAILGALTDLDLSDQALPFMRWRAGRVAGVSARVFRIAYTGGLGYEIAVPAAYGLSVWERLLEETVACGGAPFGSEAQHVMRAEAGYVMIGEETDGAVSPLDLGLAALVDREKPDFIGKRALERAYFHAPERWRLVGLESEAAEEPLPIGAYLIEGERIQAKRADAPPASRPKPIGRVSSSYWSPTLNRAIALALVEGGTRRLGETVTIGDEGRAHRAVVTRPGWLDAEGAPLARPEPATPKPEPRDDAPAREDQGPEGRDAEGQEEVSS